ncbi:MAG: M20/M25/M40 family metallo-hydrolase [Ignavibacteriales bacterium]|nr:M20/M25/M40 family metallo-hydrolase [Ignavibacteriales bacterium]
MVKSFDKITRTALADTFGYNLLRELCAFGGRLSGSKNLINVEDFLLKKMSGLGFDTVYTQTFTTTNWQRGNVEKFILRGKNSGSDIKFEVAALGGSVGTEGILRADVIEISDFDELEKRKNEIKGKIVFFNFEFDQKVYDSFSSYGPAVNFRVNGVHRAAKYGAVAVLIRSVASNFDDVPHTGTLRYVDTIPKIPGVALGVRSAAFLAELLKNGQGEITQPLLFEMELDCKTEGTCEVKNLIAEIWGSENKNEVIVVGAHLDSWDKGEGAHDDGAGCVQSIEVLHLIKKMGIKPKRTIRAVLFANEENGLAGAKGYAKVTQDDVKKHYAAIESDRGGFVPRGFTTDAPPEVISKMSSWLPYFKMTGIEWFKNGGGGADISQIKGSKALIGFYPDSQRYFDVHHSENDVFSSVNHRELELGSASITILTLLLSEFGL